VLNNPVAVATSADKLAFFQASLHWNSAEVREVIIPWTTDKDEAEGWLSDGDRVVVRHTTRGSGGQGIDVINEGDLPHAPLYTKYIKKSAEYRVHVKCRQGLEDRLPVVFDAQQKRKQNDNEDVDYQIRSHANGWVFCRSGIEVPEYVTNAAKLVVAELGLDFGAVDVVYNRHYNRAYVLEVNTAPGLEGTTLTTYTDMIRARARSLE
jgi:glutathione synthase/RimK-type ligase-like ATP-grasp enzyme